MVWFEKLKDIAVVGNGAVAPEHAQAIDRHDCVIRFNGGWNYVQSGLKTNVVVMANNGPAGLLNLKNVHPEMIARAEEFWFTKSVSLIEEEKIKPFPGDADESIWIDYSRDIIDRHFGSKPYYFFEPKLYHEAKNRLESFGAVHPFEPSSGVLTLVYLNKKFPGKIINLFGFSFEGWSGHSWNAEKRFCDNLLSSQ